MKKIFKKIIIKLADSILIIIISVIALGSASFVYAQISNFAYNPSVKSLTKDGYDSLVTKINELITKQNSISTDTNKIKLTVDSSSCTWQPILTHGQKECPDGFYINAMCLSNSDTGCPNGIAGTNGNHNWETTGAIKCCRAGTRIN